MFDGMLGFDCLMGCSPTRSTLGRGRRIIWNAKPKVNASAGWCLAVWPSSLLSGPAWLPACRNINYLYELDTL